MSTAFTVAVPEPLRTRLSQAAAERGETLDGLVASALEAFLHDEAAFTSAVRQGLASLDAGRGIGLEEVAAKWSARLDRPGR